MQHFIQQIMAAGFIARWKLLIMAAMAKCGIWGVGIVALVDASTIPVPTEIVLAGYIWHDKSHFWLYCLLASVGSSIGGLVPYGLGRAGGELFLLKHIKRERLEQIRTRFSRQEFLAIMIPSMLPPPTPWKTFVFAAGVFEMKVLPFVAAVFTGRMVRCLVLALLVLKLGPGAVGVVAHHAIRAVSIVSVLALGGFIWWWIKKKRTGQI